MAQLFNINDWSEQQWLNTGGTRNKKIYLNPSDNQLYYFKQSFKKGKKDYKYEFWSEIIAFEVGQMCGFNVLPYHVAVRDHDVGCISKSMISSDKEELVEGGRYIQAFDNTFNPEDRSLRYQYSFELVTASLAFIGLQKYYSDFIEMLVFDALIGNSDRHQENWAIINGHSRISKSLAFIEFLVGHRKYFDKLPKIVKAFIRAIYISNGKLRPQFRRVRLSLPKDTRFSPIYDNGCSFGRELLDDKVSEMLKDTKLIDKYISKGVSEIHWKGKKVSHFALLDNLLEDEDFKPMVQNTVRRVVEKFDAEQFNKLISIVDGDLPSECQYIKIPSERKELIRKLVLSRFNSLKILLEKKVK